MPKTFKLSWQPGVGNREGRWRKIYRGKAYHFPGGKGKSDREGYDAAWAAWESLKFKIDQESPRKYQQDYEQCIGQWQKVLSWSSRHGDQEHAGRAERKLVDLRRGFTAAKLTPLARSDWFEAMFDSPLTADAAFAAQIEKSMEDFNNLPARERIESFFGDSDKRTPEATATIEKLLQVDQLLGEIGNTQIPGPRQFIKPSEDWDISPRRIDKAIWRDRLAAQERTAAPEDQSLGGQVKRFLEHKETQASTGELSVGRLYTLRTHLDGFRDWQGTDTHVKEIDGAMLLRYKDHLRQKVAGGDWSLATAGHCLGSVKTFVRWLFETEVIAELPRVLAIKSTSLKISKPEPRKVTFEKVEIKTLLKDARDRMKLCILLSLNCSMTQKDIGDLLVSEVSWNEGRIIRKRSKTRDEENVPLVLKQANAEGVRDRFLGRRAGRNSERPTPRRSEKVSDCSVFHVGLGCCTQCGSG